MKNIKIKYEHYPVLLLLFFLLIIFLPKLISGQVIYWGTASLQFVPWQVEGWRQVSNGVIPLWNPLNGMGAPLLANYQSGFLYPPNWILYLFYVIGDAPALAWGYTLLTFFHLFWAGLGMIRLIKRLGLNLFSQALAGIAYGLCGALLARTSFMSMVWTAAWFPWIVGLSFHLVRGQSVNKFGRLWIPVGLTASIAMLLLAGHAQYAFYILIFNSVWILFLVFSRDKNERSLNPLWRYISAIVVAVLIAAWQLIPPLEYLIQSQRASSVEMNYALNYSFWPWRFLSFLMPNFFGNPGSGNFWGFGNYWEDSIYIGLFPFILAVLSLLLLKKNGDAGAKSLKSLLIFLWTFVIIGSLLALGKNTPIFPFFYKYVPTFDMFQAPTRFMLWVDFCLIVLAAMSAGQIQQLAVFKKRRLKKWMVVSVAIVIGSLATFLFIRDIEDSTILGALIMGLNGVLVGFLLLKMPPNDGQKRKFLEIGLIVLVGADIIFAANGIIPFVSVRFYDEVQSVQSEQLYQNSRVYLNQTDEEWIKFARFLRFEDFNLIEDVKNIRQTYLPNLNILSGQSSANNFDPFVPDRFATWMAYINDLDEVDIAPWLDLMNVNQVVKVDNDSVAGVTITDTETAGPLNWFGCSKAAENEVVAWNLLVNRLNSMDKSGLERECVILENFDSTTYPEASVSHLELTYQKADELQIDYESSGNGIIEISQTFYPGWKAFIDNGDQIQIYRADYLFQALQVPAGKHSVLLKYQPWWKPTLPAISISCAVLLLVVFVRQKYSVQEKTHL